MKSYFKKYSLLVLIAFLAVVAVLFKLFYRPPVLPLVVKVDPPSGTQNESLKEIKIFLDQPVEDRKENFSLYVNPPVSFDLRFQEQEIIVTLQNELLPGEKYFFELGYQAKSIYSWSYEIAALPSVEPTVESGKGDPGIRREILEEALSSYPLINFVPYETESFYLNYLEPLKLVVKIKKGDQGVVKWEVYEWLKSKGVAPDTHEIEWISP